MTKYIRSFLLPSSFIIEQLWTNMINLLSFANTVFVMHPVQNPPLCSRTVGLQPQEVRYCTVCRLFLIELTLVLFSVVLYAPSYNYWRGLFNYCLIGGRGRGRGGGEGEGGIHLSAQPVLQSFTLSAFIQLHFCLYNIYIFAKNFLSGYFFIITLIVHFSRISTFCLLYNWWEKFYKCVFNLKKCFVQ